MGLKITSIVATDKGSSNEVYLLINEIYITKTLSTQLVCKTYKSKADRDANIDNTCSTFNIPLMYKPTLESITVTINDLYALIKLELEAQGLTVEIIN